MKFEYKTEYFGSHEFAMSRLDKYLNNKGKEGWELVHVMTKKMMHDLSEIATYTFIFKRIKK